MRSVPLVVDEEGRERLPAVQPARALALSLGVLTLLKQITGLSQPPEKERGRALKK